MKLQLNWYFCLMPELKSFLRVYRFHLWLLLAALGWIAVFNALLQLDAQTFISFDARSYQQSAFNLYQSHIGHNYRPVLMAMINGIPYLFGADDASVYVFAIWVNLFCWLGSLLVLFAILKQFLPERKAFWWALPAVFLTGWSAVVFELATECIYLFMMLSAFYFIQRHFRTEVFKYLAFALALLVLSMLVKPGSKFLAILLTLYFIKPLIFNYASKFTFLVYGSYLLVLVQCAGLKYQFGNFTISYIDAVTYYSYLGAKAESLDTDQSFKEVWKQRTDYIYSRPCPEQKQIASSDFKHQLKSDTVNLFKAYVFNLWENATTGSVKIQTIEKIKPSNYLDNSKILAFNISKVQNWVLSMAGFTLTLLFFLRTKWYGKAYVQIAFFVAYIMLLSGVSCSEGDRFNLVTFPFVIVLLARFAAGKNARA